MILVTVGMHPAGFLRLVQAMDRIANTLDEEVVMQIGNTPYNPRTANWFTFATQEEMDTLSQKARVIVCHAGAGSILTGLRHRKPLIVVPRLRKYDEHIDDHQIELAQELAKSGVLLNAREPANLLTCLKSAEGFTPQLPGRSHLVTAVRAALYSNVARRE